MISVGLNMQNFLSFNTGAQPGFFSGRGGFLEKEYFNKHFIYNTQK